MTKSSEDEFLGRDLRAEPSSSEESSASSTSIRSVEGGNGAVCM